MDELSEQFLIEGRELIAEATEELVSAERDPASAGIDAAFRAVHTLKGSVGIFDLAPMGAVLHAAEDLLGAARAGRVAMSVAIAQGLLACLDHCDRWMDLFEESGALPPEASKDAIRIANGLAALSGDFAAAAAAVPDSAPWAEKLVELESERIDAARREGAPLTAIRYAPRDDCFFAGDDPLALVAAIPELVALRVTPRDPWPPIDEIDPYRCNLLFEAASAASISDIRQLFRLIPDQAEIVALPGGPSVAAPVADGGQRTIRVDSLQIDRMLDLVAELVVTKNGLAHLASEAEAGAPPAALAAAIRASGLAADRLIVGIHRAVMDIRMVPLERLFRRIARLVREIAATLGREVDLSVEGEAIRVDKAVADTLFEPLLHVIRNAVDHGIEPEAERARRGKPRRGRITLAARSLGDQILIEVSDDGGGIDPARLRDVAVARALVSDEAAAGLDDEAALRLVFAPGFSTASSISQVSGRGVGMDAVKAAVERLGGRVALASRLSIGTQVTLHLPATAALATILIVEAGGERFGIPFDAIAETLRIRRDSVMPVGLGLAFVLRDRTVPLLDLGELLGLDPASGEGDLRILVVDSGHGPVGLVVQSFSDRLDVVLRPITGLLARMPGISGTTLLGDGSVLLILDLREVIE